MIDIKLFKASAVRQLFESVPANLALYRSGNFNSMISDNALFLEPVCKLSLDAINEVRCDLGDDREVECCLAIAKGLVGITPYLARDERLWVRLAHVEFLDYSRSRWVIPENDEKAVNHIRKHFFAVGSRGIERDNAISRLWWMATICAKVKNLSLEDALKAFLFQSDVRANIIERPTTSQNPTVLSAVINKLHDSYNGDQSLFEREHFRAVMKKLNIEGGIRLLEALESNDVELVIDKVMQ